MAVNSEVNTHRIQSLTNIHKHMELVCNAMLDTEHDFIERGYLITWEGVSTYAGQPGMMDGFTTHLKYSVALDETTAPTPTNKTNVEEQDNEKA